MPTPTRPCSGPQGSRLRRRARRRLGALVVVSGLAALGACGPTPDEGAGAAGTPVAGPSADPLLSGSAAPGAGAGLAILNPVDPTLPFHNDLGSIPRGETRLWTVEFMNQDAAPVELNSARGSCGCMHVRALRAFPADGGPPIKGAPNALAPPLITIPPGARLEVTIEVTTERVQANLKKAAQLNLSTTSSASPFVTLVAQFVAVDAFTVNPRELLFGDIPESQGKSAKVRILAEPAGGPARILGIERQGPRVRAELEETFYGGEFVWHLLAHVDPLEPLGAVREPIVLRTTDIEGNGEAGRLQVFALGTVKPDVRIDPPQFTFGAVQVGTRGAVDGRLDALVPGARLKVRGHRFEGESAPHLELEVRPVAPDEAGRARTIELGVRARETLPLGPIVARLVLETDDAQNPTVSVPVGGRVVR